MNPEILPRYFTLSLFLLFFVLELSAQGGKNNLTAAGDGNSFSDSNNSKENYANVFIYYPISKSGEGISIFLNKRNIAKLANGGRLECRLLREGPVAITLIEGNSYREPLTQSKNSRTITIRKGKPYYFRVTGKGELEYIFNPEKGEKNYNESKEFIYKPIYFTETPDSMIP